MLNGFAPIADEYARVLILGTMPSVQSINKVEYYGNPQNAFWRIVFGLWGKSLPERYEERTAFLMEKHIALWDVLQLCEREGSADSKIAHPTANDFINLSGKCPHLQGIFFNSKNAEYYYNRLVKPDPFLSLPKTTLPSTSPARAMKFEKKQALWVPLRHFLDEIEPKAI